MDPGQLEKLAFDDKASGSDTRHAYYVILKALTSCRLAAITLIVMKQLKDR
jgi:hypothetical protein